MYVASHYAIYKSYSSIVRILLCSNLGLVESYKLSRFNIEFIEFW